MKLVSGEIAEALDPKITKVVCVVSAQGLPGMVMEFYKENVLYKTVSITGVPNSELEQSWKIIEYTLRFAMDLETEKRYV
jgi:hypothetical protein